MIPPDLLRRVRVAAAALVATLLAVAWVLLRAHGLPGSAPPHREARTMPFTDVHPYGANFFLEREPDPRKREAAVALAEEAGLRWARQQIPWAEVQVSEDGPYRWEKFDAIVELCRAHGIDVIARLDWSPEWVREGYVPGANNPPDADHVADYAAFAAAAAAHFRDRVRFYQVWNEPNLRTEWGHEPVNPEAYVELLATAAAAIRAADPQAVVLAAPLAITTEGPEVAGNMSDLEYLDRMYRAGAADHFDIMAANAFGMDRPPDDPPAVDVLNMRRIELQRDVMAAHDDADKAIWLSEYGWNAAPADMPAERLIWQRVTEETQAQWTVEGVRWAQEHWPWVGVFGIWYFQYHRAAPDKPEYYFRMLDLDFTPRRVFAAVRDDAAAMSVATAGEWGEYSSPVEVGPGWRWAWSEGTRDGNALVAAADGASLAFTFTGTSVDARVRGGGDLAWRLDGEPIKPSSGGEEGWRWIRVGEALSPTEHRLEATVVGVAAPEEEGGAKPAAAAGRSAAPRAADDATPAVDGFRVTYAGGVAAASRQVAALLAIAAVLALMLFRDLRAAAGRIPE